MKASEYIAAMQAIVDEHGDLPVVSVHDEVVNPPAFVEVGGPPVIVVGFVKP